MEQNSTPKIVSLHMEPCSNKCPHTGVCYHKRKVLQFPNWGTFPLDFRKQMLDRGYIIHESICDKLDPSDLLLISQYKNYNITIPFDQVTLELSTYRKQVQISVYNKEQAKSLPLNQKIFLIKDDETFEYFQRERLWNIPYSFMHFVINQDWITKDRLGDITYYVMLSNAAGTTIDSCAASWITNGRCPYGHGNYVDITFDGSLRTCPFSRDGIPITEVYDGTYESLFRIQHKPGKCKYEKLFGEVNGEIKHTSIQDNSTDNKD